MEKCKHYHSMAGTGIFASAGICFGTKECDPCNCGGDESKCNYYPEKRNKAAKKTMNTAEMWLEAQETGVYYECTNGDIAYSKKYGLTEKGAPDRVWRLGNWDEEGAEALDKLLGDCEWVRSEEPISIEEAEKLLGRRILID